MHYGASKDGFKKTDFLDKCANQNSTICVVQTPQNNVFGGYTSLEWDREKALNQSVSYDDDPIAFMYSIRSSEGQKSELFPVQNKGHRAIQHCTKFTLYPTFVPLKGTTSRKPQFRGNSCSIDVRII